MTNPLNIIKLSSGTSAVNFIAYLLACLFTISIFVFFNSMQTFVLSLILQVPNTRLASTGGSLVFFDQLLSILLLGSWGIVSDKMGRRVIFSLGFIIMGISMMGFSFARTVYPELLLWRLLFAIGAAAASGMITAVLADYVAERDKGKVSGLVGMMSGVGALIGVFIFGGMPPFIHSYEGNLIKCLNYTYLSIGAFTVCFGIVLAFALKAPVDGDIFSVSYWKKSKHHQSADFLNSNPSLSQDLGDYVPVRKDNVNGAISNDDTAAYIDSDMEKCPHPISKDMPASSCPFSGATRSMNTGTGDDERMGCTMPGALEHPDLSQRSFWSLAREGFLLGLKNPSLLLAYFGGFIARGDSIIITLFLPLWINRYYIENGTCSPITDSSLNPGEFKDPTRGCDIAFTKAFMYSGIAQTFALIAAPVFGLLSDRLSKTWIFLVAALFSFLGYFPLSFIDDPVQNKLMFLLMVVLGIGEIGMIVTSLSLATYQMPKEVRGSVAGCYSLFGGLGILIMTSLGGLLADSWINGPFFVVGTMSGLAVIVSGVVKIIEGKNR